MSSTDVQHDSDAKSVIELVEKIRAGDMRAEAELAERFARGVHFYLRNNGGRDVVKDLWQETFRIALVKIRNGALREPEKLNSFLRGIAHTLLRAQARKSAARSEDGLEAAAAVHSAETDPFDYARRNQEAALIQQALKQLKPRDRAVLERFYLAEDDKARICAELDLPPSQFNQVLDRARERFKKFYERLLRQRRRKSPSGQ